MKSPIHLYEASERLGGRIESWRIDPNSQGDIKRGDKSRIKISELLKDNDKLKKSEADKKQPRKLDDILVAEFGPMRIEPDHQPYVNRLLDDLWITPQQPVPHSQEKWSDLVPFPPYQGPPPDQPAFKLDPEESEQATLVDLLLLALRRVFEVTTFRGELQADGEGQGNSEDQENRDDQKKDCPWTICEQWTSHDPNKLLEAFQSRTEYDKYFKEAKPYDEANFYWKEFKELSHLHRRFWKRSLMQWILLLDEPHHQFIFHFAEFRGTLLKDLGFWNLIAAVLSHMACVKLRDWASFYHLLPDNPSAAVWVVFWLRAIKSSNALKGIRGGMDFIIHELCRKLAFVVDTEKEESEDRHYVAYKKGSKNDAITQRKRDDHDRNLRTKYDQREREQDHLLNTVDLSLNSKLIRVEEKKKDGEEVYELTFQRTEEIPKDNNKIEVTITVKGHVILALPKSALQDIEFVRENKHIGQELRAIFDTVMVIPLLKCFFVFADPFWADNRPPNLYAHTVPTREVHYWKSKDKRTGMIMLYTDRPALQYWSPLNDYEKNEPIGPSEDLKIVTYKRYREHARIWGWKDSESYKDKGWKNEKFDNDLLLRTFLLYVKEEGAESVTADRLLAAGMHDWSLKPYEGACHAWRPGSDAAKVMKYLSAFTLGREAKDDNDRKLHICGEAYSTYHGFVEGALRSAALVLTKKPFKIPNDRLTPKPDKRPYIRTTKVPKSPSST